MRIVAALAAAVVLGLFSAGVAAQSGVTAQSGMAAQSVPCVNQTDALIKARDNVIASLKQFWFTLCDKTDFLLSGKQCAGQAEADTEIAKSDTIKRLNAEINSVGNRCQTRSMFEAMALVKSLPNCRIEPDGRNTTIQCSTPVSFELCRKAAPWSPGNCHIWNGQPMAPCCKLFNWQ